IEDGDWAEDPTNPLYFLVRQERVALPLYPQFGTEPNIYYIPPRWVPRPYLRQMFGPGVDEAITRYTNPSRELLAVLQLFRASQKIIFRYEIEEGEKIEGTDIFNDTVIGFDKEGNEVVRLPVQEPFYVRAEKYQNSI
ncbi:MAG: nitrate oxidoreductase subunit beta, partial [bacterium]